MSTPKTIRLLVSNGNKDKFVRVPVTTQMRELLEKAEDYRKLSAKFRLAKKRLEWECKEIAGRIYNAKDDDFKSRWC